MYSIPCSDGQAAGRMPRAQGSPSPRGNRHLHLHIRIASITAESMHAATPPFVTNADGDLLLSSLSVLRSRRCTNGTTATATRNASWPAPEAAGHVDGGSCSPAPDDGHVPAGPTPTCQHATALELDPLGCLSPRRNTHSGAAAAGDPIVSVCLSCPFRPLRSWESCLPACLTRHDMHPSRDAVYFSAPVAAPESE
jgi:hypothetical protein